MNTWTHVLINTVAARMYQRRKNAPNTDKPIPLQTSRIVKTTAFAAMLPDIPLFILTIWFLAVYGFEFNAYYDELFFHNPLWVISHNFFHTPLIIIAVLLLGCALKKKPYSIYIRWFAVSLLLHSVFDIAVHHHDGPLLLFPFNWQLRIISPISYWDTNHHARIIALIELGIDLILLAVWIYWWHKNRKARRHSIQQ